MTPDRDNAANARLRALFRKTPADDAPEKLAADALECAGRLDDAADALDATRLGKARELAALARPALVNLLGVVYIREGTAERPTMRRARPKSELFRLLRPALDAVNALIDAEPLDAGGAGRLRDGALGLRDPRARFRTGYVAADIRSVLAGKRSRCTPAMVRAAMAEARLSAPAGRGGAAWRLTVDETARVFALITGRKRGDAGHKRQAAAELDALEWTFALNGADFWPWPKPQS